MATVKALTITTAGRTRQHDPDADDLDTGSLLPRRHIEMVEVADPATPAANKARFYIRDNGLASPNNRTQFCAKWPDGTVTVIAESPAA